MFKTKTPLGKDGKPLKQSGKSIVGYLESHQFYYNANNELTQSISITQEGLNLTEVTTTYQYDAFGRRISKHSQTKEKTKFVNRQTTKILKFPVQKEKTQHKQVNYLWDGNRQLQEQTDTHVFTTIYEQNSFEPVARLVWLQDGVQIAANEPEYRSVWDDKPKPQSDVQIYHCHNDHLGTPNELTNQDGEVVWLADYEAYGNTAKVVWREEKLGQLKVSSEELQPIRFQGQSFDTETGLHYNRFRYFDPDLGMFISRDPIGLLGGSNVFQYAPNPVGWVDPWGLTCTNNDNRWNQFQSNSRGLFSSRTQAAEAYQLWKAQNWTSLENLMGPGSWPPNRGFVSIKTTTLQPGTRIDRYGGWYQNGRFYDKGTFVSPAGNSFGSRALPAETTQKPYNIYEVTSPIDVKSGPAIPWFGQEGLGTQHELPSGIDDLLQNGVIRKL